MSEPGSQRSAGRRRIEAADADEGYRVAMSLAPSFATPHFQPNASANRMTGRSMRGLRTASQARNGESPSRRVRSALVERAFMAFPLSRRRRPRAALTLGSFDRSKPRSGQLFVKVKLYRRFASDRICGGNGGGVQTTMAKVTSMPIRRILI
jgi:hypothetical protein